MYLKKYFLLINVTGESMTLQSLSWSIKDMNLCWMKTICLCKRVGTGCAFRWQECVCSSLNLMVFTGLFGGYEVGDGRHENRTGWGRVLPSLSSSSTPIYLPVTLRIPNGDEKLNPISVPNGFGYSRPIPVPAVNHFF